MNNRPQTPVRELDRRTSDGIEVTLLWNSHTGRVSVAVEDARRDESLEFEVHPAQALTAFFHPYAHAPDPHAHAPDDHTHRPAGHRSRDAAT